MVVRGFDVEEVRSSILLAPTTPQVTSGNAGHHRVRGRLVRPHNGWTPLNCATVGRMDRPAGLPALLGSFERHLRAENRADTTV
jgi:hypothetical protein